MPPQIIRQCGYDSKPPPPAWASRKTMLTVERTSIKWSFIPFISWLLWCFEASPLYFSPICCINFFQPLYNWSMLEPVYHVYHVANDVNTTPRALFTQALTFGLTNCARQQTDDSPITILKGIWASSFWDIPGPMLKKTQKNEMCHIGSNHAWHISVLGGAKPTHGPTRKGAGKMLQTATQCL